MIGSGSGKNSFFFGAAQPVLQDKPSLDEPLSKGPGISKEATILISVVLGLFVVLLIWAKFIRTWKPRKRLSHGKKVYRESSRSSSDGEDGEDSEDEDEAEETEQGDKDRRRYKYRYRRRKHRQRNPTLAETGGLPPVKEE